MKRVSLRTCIGCLNKRPKVNLRRLVVRNGKVIVDLTGKAQGRGAYLCKRGRGISQSCLKLAKEKNVFKKSFRREIRQTSNCGGLGSY